MKYCIQVFIVVTAMVVSSCNKEKGCTDEHASNYHEEAGKDDGSCLYQSDVSIVFSHDFDGVAVSTSNFNQFNFITENNDTISISKLRYLLSDITFHKTTGEKTTACKYQLIDLNDSESTSIKLDSIDYGSYTSIDFTFGFDAENNTGDYLDLNSANWNWPDMTGGGYHFMQFEGMFMNDGTQTPFSYHYGTASNDGVHEENHFKIRISNITLSNNNTTLNIKMNLAEWFKNPNTWDLGTHHKMLMGNYDVQKLMQAQGPSVFSAGAQVNE